MSLLLALVLAQDLDRYVWEAPVVAFAPSKETEPLVEILDREVAKMLAAGHLAPYRLPYTEGRPFYYWLNAGDTLRALSLALPFLSAARQAEVKDYLKAEISKYGLKMLAPDDGSRRESFPLPKGGAREGWSERNDLLRQRSYLYGIACYAQATGDWATAEKLLDEMVRIAASIKDLSYEAISNLIGVVRVAKHAGRQDVVDQLMPRLRELLAQGKDFKGWSFEYNQRYNAAMRLPNTVYISTCGILIDLSPEMGRFLADHAKEQVAAFVDRKEKFVPLWFIARGPGHVGLADPEYLKGRKAEAGQTQDEISSAPPYATGPIFFAKAMVLGEDPAVLRTYLDVPQCRVGDLECLEKLSALLRRHAKVTWEPLRP